MDFLTVLPLKIGHSCSRVFELDLRFHQEFYVSRVSSLYVNLNYIAHFIHYLQD